MDHVETGDKLSSGMYVDAWHYGTENNGTEKILAVDPPHDKRHNDSKTM